MTSSPKNTKNSPKGWSSKDDAVLDKAIRKALPPSKALEDLARSDDAVPSPLRDDNRGGTPLNRSSHTRQKKV
jgi:hypothetical protein